MIVQPVFLKQRLQRARPAPESESVDRQNGRARIDPINRVAGGFEPALKCLAHYHPERVTSGSAVASGKQEFVRPRMLGPPVVETKTANFWANQVRRHI